MSGNTQTGKSISPGHHSLESGSNRSPSELVFTPSDSESEASAGIGQSARISTSGTETESDSQAESAPAVLSASLQAPNSAGSSSRRQTAAFGTPASHAVKSGRGRPGSGETRLGSGLEIKPVRSNNGGLVRDTPLRWQPSPEQLAALQSDYSLLISACKGGSGSSLSEV
ncbi:unnamed protein product [Protopolystoma xenopodis]|uniref:Uncharacterized protein n=1 Tax=Protopolystoma xenopodis TaxID=117903 RepID=A0A448W9P5_9PLAT|nr:unnamed protein product [Protopolystoma xenopodis]